MTAKHNLLFKIHKLSLSIFGETDKTLLKKPILLSLKKYTNMLRFDNFSLKSYFYSGKKKLIKNNVVTLLDINETSVGVQSNLAEHFFYVNDAQDK